MAAPYCPAHTLGNMGIFMLTRYLTNLLAWLKGFGTLADLDYRPGWSVWSYAPVYAIDVGLNVLTGGAPFQTLSASLQYHRGAWLWDKILDILEVFDKKHGVDALAGKEHLSELELPGAARLAIIATLLGVPVLWIF